MLERVETNVYLGVNLSLRQPKFLLGSFRSDRWCTRECRARRHFGSHWRGKTRLRLAAQLDRQPAKQETIPIETATDTSNRTTFTKNRGPGYPRQFQDRRQTEQIDSATYSSPRN